MKNHLYRSLASAHAVPQNKRVPLQKVDLRMLKVRTPSTTDLIKSLHRTGGQPLQKVQDEPAVETPSAVVPVQRATTALAEPGAVTTGVRDRLEGEAVAGTIKRVHDTGGYRLGLLGPERK
jgi:hypothetical protein